MTTRTVESQGGKLEVGDAVQWDTFVAWAMEVVGACVVGIKVGIKVGPEVAS